MSCNYQSTKPIIIQFPRFAGGKFISNCLSLSKHTVPQEQIAAEYLLQNPTDYQYRYNAVLKTLPPNKQAMRQWIKLYEYGDWQLYSTAHEKWIQGKHCVTGINDITVALSNGPLHFFLVSHTHSANLLKIWPNARVIVLINHKNFSEISRLWKSTDVKTIQDHAGNYCAEKYASLMGSNWPSWQEFELSGFDVSQFDARYDSNIIDEIKQYYPIYHTTKKIITFDIDSNIFNKDTFLSSVQNLYTKLGFDDFNNQLVENFWQSYIKLHV